MFLTWLSVTYTYGGQVCSKGWQLKGAYGTLWKPITELRSVTCHMESQCYLPTVECTPPQSQRGRLVINVSIPKGWKAESTSGWFTCGETVIHPGSNHILALFSDTHQVYKWLSSSADLMLDKRGANGEIIHRLHKKKLSVAKRNRNLRNKQISAIFWTQFHNNVD